MNVKIGWHCSCLKLSSRVMYQWFPYLHRFVGDIAIFYMMELDVRCNSKRLLAWFVVLMKLMRSRGWSMYKCFRLNCNIQLYLEVRSQQILPLVCVYEDPLCAWSIPRVHWSLGWWWVGIGLGSSRFKTSLWPWFGTKCMADRQGVEWQL